MVKSSAAACRTPQKSAIQRERFPSHAHWEASREAVVTLKSLRANAKAIDASGSLFKDERFEGGSLSIRQSDLQRAVGALSLDAPSTDRLLADAMLVSSWYLLPARRTYMGTDAGSDLAALVKVAKAAKPFADLTFTDVQAAQGLIRALDHGDGSPSDDLHLQMMHNDMGVLIATAARIRERLRPVAGRARDSRRDHTLGLIAAAVSEATGEAPAMSRGTGARPLPHFRNPSGHFVLSVMNLLGWPDEHILASAFERQRREQCVKV